MSDGISALTTGIPEVDQHLADLESKVARSVTRSAVNSGLTQLAKAIRKQVDNTPDLSKEMKRALKKLIGKRFKRKKRRSQEYEAKAGFGVGNTHKREIARSGNNAGGIGIAGANIHWFAAGTSDRRTGRNRFSGRLKAIPVIQTAYTASWQLVAGTMKATAFARLDLELRKLAAK